MNDSPTAQLRILIVDDHLVMRAGLKLLIENHPRMNVVGMARDRKEAMELAASESPDVILLDLEMGDDNGINLLPELRDSAKDAPLLVLTGIKDPEVHRSAIRQGAMGVVLKTESAEVLLKAIEKIHAGEIWLDRTAMGNLFSEMTSNTSSQNSVAAKIGSLTERERQVIKLIAEGLKNKQIGERMFISKTTVTHHLTSIFSKLELSDRLELVIYSFTHGLARIPYGRKSGL